MGFTNTTYTNNKGEKIPAEIVVKEQTPTDTIVKLTPKVNYGTTHLITLSGPDSSVLTYTGEDGYIPENDYKDYWVRAAREAYGNRVSLGNAAKLYIGDILNKLKLLIGIKQQGGTMQQNDMQQQIIQLVQAAAQGDQQANQQIESIMQAAQQGDQQAVQIAQMIQQVIEAMKQQQARAKVAKLGTKLDYINKLKGVCPEGTEKVYLKSGGCICQKKKENGGQLKETKKMNAVERFKSAQKGTKLPKKYDEKKHERLAIGEAEGKNTKAQQDSLSHYRKLYNQKSNTEKYKMGDQQAGYELDKTKKKACGGSMKKNK